MCVCGGVKDRVSMCSSGCPVTPSVYQASLRGPHGPKCWDYRHMQPVP